MPATIRLLSLLLATATLLLGGCASPTGSGAATPPTGSGAAAAPARAAAPEAGDKSVAAVDRSDEIVCKKYTVTGSRIAQRKVCKTRAEWVDYARHMKEAMRNAERRSTGSGPPPSMGGG